MLSTKPTPAKVHMTTGAPAPAAPSRSTDSVVSGGVAAERQVALRDRVGDRADRQEQVADVELVAAAGRRGGVEAGDDVAEVGREIDLNVIRLELAGGIGEIELVGAFCRR